MKIDEKEKIFDRLQMLLKEFQEIRADIVVCRTVDCGYGDIVRETSHWRTDELNEALAQIRDFEEGKK